MTEQDDPTNIYKRGYRCPDAVTSIILPAFEELIMAESTTYKYCFKVDGKIVHCGITTDLAGREREHRRRWPEGYIEQLGPATTHEEALSWERQQAEQRVISAS